MAISGNFFKGFLKKTTTTASRKVLIVEDDAMLLKVLSESLRVEKMDVLLVKNGSKAFDEAFNFLPDIILLDLILPGLDGFEVLKQLKNNKRTEQIPVIVLSNLDQESDIKSIRALGAEQYFLKSNTDLSVIVKYVKDRLNK